MKTVSVFKVVKQVHDDVFVIEDSIELDELSPRYPSTLCECDPLRRDYDDDGRCIVDYLFYVKQGYGPFIECSDPREYVDGSDCSSFDHASPAHKQCLIERSGQIDEYDEEQLLI